MKSLLLALQFLTVIPLKIKAANEAEISRAQIYFPAVGLILGLILGLVNIFLSVLEFPQFAINIILVALLAILTGGLHLDGLADTADALLSGKDKDGMLSIMRDAHIGAMGVISLICIMLLKIAFLSSLNMQSKIMPLVLMCILSRWALVFVIFLFPYARQEGKAKVFKEGASLKITALSTVITLVLVLLAGQLKGLLVFAAVAPTAYLTAKAISRKFDGLTGDTLGAINEITELTVLFCLCILERILL